MLVCSGGRYFNVGPPSSSPFPLAAWTAAGGLRERFERVRAQETEDRRGSVSTTATASQAHDGHDFVCCGSGGLFDDEEPYKVWHVKRSVGNSTFSLFFGKSNSFFLIINIFI
jgi:hypothetical protein